MDTPNSEVRRSIGDEGIAYEGLPKGVDTGKGTRHETVGQTGECDESVITIGVHHDSTDMYDYGAN